MPSIGHIAVGAAAGRLFARERGGKEIAPAMGLLSIASLLPDADGISFSLGIPYSAPWGHRGASHSLVMAGAIGLATAMAARALRLPFGRALFFGTLTAASHGLLDTLTDGGLGIALLWPFSNRRFFAPWRPLPVAPIGLGMLSRRGLEVLAAELLFFAPVWLYAFRARER